MEAFGIDLGSGSAFQVSSSGDIIRNELGGHSSGSLVAFSGLERVIGEAAVGQASTNPKNTVSQLLLLLAAADGGVESFEKRPSARHLAFKRSAAAESGGGGLIVEVDYTSPQAPGAPESTGKRGFKAEAVAAMLLAKLRTLAEASSSASSSSAGSCAKFGLAVPPWLGTNARRALLDAAAVAGLGPKGAKGAVLVDGPEALARVLAKKHPLVHSAAEAPPAAEESAEESAEGGAGGEGAAAEVAVATGRVHLVVDVGATHATVSVVRVLPVNPSSEGPEGGKAFEVLASGSDPNLGVAALDELLFDLMRNKAKAKLQSQGVSYGSVGEPGTKGGQRLLRAVERARKLLSTMTICEVAVEGLVPGDDRDVKLEVSRPELEKSAEHFLAGVHDLVARSLKEAQESAQEAQAAAAGAKVAGFSASLAASLASVETLGGGTRVPCVQEAIAKAVHEASGRKEAALPGGAFGMKLDSAALAFGAALAAAAAAEAEAAAAGGVPPPTLDAEAAESPEPPVVPPQAPEAPAPEAPALPPGLGAAALEALRSQEAAMASQDAALAARAAVLNELEALVLGARGYADHPKHGQLVPRAQLDEVLNGAEEWLWSDAAAEATLEDAAQKLHELKRVVQGELGEQGSEGGLAGAYLAAVAADARALEAEMELAAKQAEAERFAEDAEGLTAADGEGSRAEKDTRRLSKPERMKKVQQHRAAGTELFKGKNFVHAAKHYKDGLAHCSKFFDLGPEDEAEVKALKVALLLNLATCWVKMENMDQVLKCADEALALDPKSAKALFRRAMVLEARKDFEAARRDLKLALEQPGASKDSAIATLVKRVDIQIRREKEKEKKMYGKMFG